MLEEHRHDLLAGADVVVGEAEGGEVRVAADEGRRLVVELVEEVAGFPFMAHDDQVDSAIMALMRFRQGGFVRLPSDEIEDELPYRPRMEYY